jgi:type IX secretion system PorP/SprF family membrane protein
MSTFENLTSNSQINLMKKILTLLLVFAFGFGYAQQDMHFSQYMYNQFVLNPAFAGQDSIASAVVLHRDQWSGMPGSPQFQTVSLETPFKKKGLGLGAILTNEQIFAQSSFSAQAVLSYNLKLSLRSKLSFGMNWGVVQYRFDPSRLDPQSPNDSRLGAGQVSKIRPEIGFGMTYRYKDRLVLGISSLHLLENQIQFDANSLSESKQARHYYLTAAYSFKLAQDWMLKTYALSKYVAGAPFQADLNAHAHYRNYGWLGLGYRTQDALSIQTGLNVNHIFKKFPNRLYVGYSFDIVTTSLRAYAGSTHEIFIGSRFAILRKKKGDAYLEKTE